MSQNDLGVIKQTSPLYSEILTKRTPNLASARHLLSIWNSCKNKLDCFLQKLLDNKESIIKEFPDLSILYRNNAIDIGQIASFYQIRSNFSTSERNIIRELVKDILLKVNSMGNTPANKTKGIYGINSHILFNSNADQITPNGVVDTIECIKFTLEKIDTTKNKLDYLVSLLTIKNENVVNLAKQTIKDIAINLPPPEQQETMERVFTSSYDSVTEKHIIDIVYNVLDKVDNKISKLYGIIFLMDVLTDDRLEKIKKDILDMYISHPDTISEFIINISNEKEELFFRKADKSFSSEQIKNSNILKNLTVTDDTRVLDILAAEATVLPTVIEAIQYEHPPVYLLSLLFIRSTTLNKTSALITAAKKIIKESDAGKTTPSTAEVNKIFLDALKEDGIKVEDDFNLEKYFLSLDYGVTKESLTLQLINELVKELGTDSSLFSIKETFSKLFKNKINGNLSFLKFIINEIVQRTNKTLLNRGINEISENLIEDGILDILKKEANNVIVSRYRSIPLKNTYQFLGFIKNIDQTNAESKNILDKLLEVEETDVVDTIQQTKANTSDLIKIFFETSSFNTKDSPDFEKYLNDRLKNFKVIIESASVFKIEDGILIQDATQNYQITIIDQVTALNIAIQLYEQLNRFKDNHEDDLVYLKTKIDALLIGINHLHLLNRDFPSSRAFRYEGNKPLKAIEQKDINSAMDANILLTKAYFNLYSLFKTPAYLKQGHMLIDQIHDYGIGKPDFLSEQLLLLKSSTDISDLDSGRLFELNINAQTLEALWQFSKIDTKRSDYWQKLIRDNVKVIKSILSSEKYLKEVYRIDFNGNIPELNDRRQKFSPIIIGVCYKFIPQILNLYYLDQGNANPTLSNSEYEELFGLINNIKVSKDTFFLSPSSETSNYLVYLRNIKGTKPVNRGEFKYSNFFMYTSADRLRVNETLNAFYNELSFLQNKPEPIDLRKKEDELLSKNKFKYRQDSLGNPSENTKELGNLISLYLDNPLDRNNYSKQIAVVLYKLAFNFARYNNISMHEKILSILNNKNDLAKFMCQLGTSNIFNLNNLDKLVDPPSDYKELSNLLIKNFSLKEFEIWEEEFLQKYLLDISFWESQKQIFSSRSSNESKRYLSELSKWIDTKNDKPMFDKVNNSNWLFNWIQNNKITAKTKNILSAASPYHMTSNYVRTFPLTAKFPEDEEAIDKNLSVMEAGYSWLNRYDEYVYTLELLQIKAEEQGNKNLAYKLRTYYLQAVNNLGHHTESQIERQSIIRTNIHYSINFLKQLADDMAKKEARPLWKQKIYLATLTEMAKSMMIIGATKEFNILMKKFFNINMNLGSVDKEELDWLRADYIDSKTVLNALNGKVILTTFTSIAGITLKDSIDIWNQLKNAGIISADGSLISTFNKSLEVKDLGLFSRYQEKGAEIIKVLLRFKGLKPIIVDQMISSNFEPEEKLNIVWDKYFTNIRYEKELIKILVDHQSRQNGKFYEPYAFSKWSIHDNHFIEKEISVLFSTDNILNKTFISDLTEEEESTFFIDVLSPGYEMQKKGFVKFSTQDQINLYTHIVAHMKNALNHQVNKSYKSYHKIFNTIYTSMDMLTKLIELTCKDEISNAYSNQYKNETEINVEKIEKNVGSQNLILDFAHGITNPGKAKKPQKLSNLVTSNITSQFSKFDWQKLLFDNELMSRDMKKYIYKLNYTSTKALFAYTHLFKVQYMGMKQNIPLLEEKLLKMEPTGENHKDLNSKLQRYREELPKVKIKLNESLKELGEEINNLRTVNFDSFYEDGQFFDIIKNIDAYQLNIAYDLQKFGIELLTRELEVNETDTLEFEKKVKGIIEKIKIFNFKLIQNQNPDFHLMRVDEKIFDFYKQLFDSMVDVLFLHPKLMNSSVLNIIKNVLKELLEQSLKTPLKNEWVKQDIHNNLIKLSFLVDTKKQTSFNNFLYDSIIEMVTKTDSSISIEHLVR